MYPLLRFFRPEHQIGFRVLLVALTIGLTIYFDHYMDNFDVDFFDFKDIVSDTLQPCLKIFIGLLIAWVCYIVIERLNQAVRIVFSRLRQQTPPASSSPHAHYLIIALIYCLTGGVLVTASAPFWYWDRLEVEMNTYTRLVEYNGRHEFELLVLHWLFDADGDGYSAVLHGGDPDDFDPTVTPLHLGVMEARDLPVDRFELFDKTRAQSLPNIC